MSALLSLGMENYSGSEYDDSVFDVVNTSASVAQPTPALSSNRPTSTHPSGSQVNPSSEASSAFRAPKRPRTTSVRDKQSHADTADGVQPLVEFGMSGLRPGQILSATCDLTAVTWHSATAPPGWPARTLRLIAEDPRDVRLSHSLAYQLAPDEMPRDLEIKATRLIAGGSRLWDVYDGYLIVPRSRSQTAHTAIPVAIKVCDTTVSPYRDIYADPDDTSYNSEAATAAVTHEIAAYCGPTRSEQGTVIPRFYGAFHENIQDRVGTPHSVYIVVQERLGRSLAQQDAAGAGILHAFFRYVCLCSQSHCDADGTVQAPARAMLCPPACERDRAR